jgi:hypothetical protein
VAQNPDGTQSKAHFQKFVFGAVTHGYEFFSSSTPPDFVAEIATALESYGYLEPVIPFNWTATSGLGESGQATAAGDKLAAQIVAELKTLVSNGTIPTDGVVDIQLICHSRGSMVMARVAQDLAAELDQIPNARAGYWRITFLDPHPSHESDVVHLAAASGDFSQELLSHAQTLQSEMMDPFPLHVPGQVADVQTYFEMTPANLAPAHSDESYINPWGTSRSQGGIVLDDPSKTAYQELHFTVPGIAHSQVHDWYVFVVLPKLNTAAGFIVTPNDALIRPTAVNVSATVGEETCYDYVATFTDDNPTSTSGSDYSAKIDWGDGTSDTVTPSANLIDSGFTVYATHLYATANTFTFTVTITDLAVSDGMVASVQGTATITESATEALGAPAGSAPLVTLRDAGTGQVISQFLAYPASFLGGVRVAVGDVNNDSIPAIITAPARGGGALVRVFDGRDQHLISQFSAYGPHFSGGVFVTTVDIDHDGRAEIVTGPGANGGAQVRAFDASSGTRLATIAVPRARHHIGVPVDATDVNQDRYLDIVAGSAATGRTQVVDGQSLAGKLARRALFAQTQAQLRRALRSLHASRRR